MKTQTIISKVLLALTLVFAVQVTASAQLGNLLNKAKNAVKEKVTDVKEDVKEEAVKETEKAAGTAKEAAGEKVAEQLKPVYKPSAEALAADPLAASEERLGGYSKTIGQIHTEYEHLDPAFYPYQPYYSEAYRNMYFMHDEESKKMHDTAHAQFMVYQNQHIVGGYTIGGYYGMPNGKVIPEGEPTINAGFAEFRADPFNTMPFTHFVRARGILHLFRDGTIKLNLQNGSKDKLKPTDDGKVLTLNETESDRLARWTREESELNQIVLNQCSIDMLAYMADYFQGVVAGQIEKDNLYLLTFWEYDACVDYLCNHNKGGYQHPAYVKHDKQRKEWADAYQSVISKAHVAAYEATHNPDIKMADLPKPAHNDSALISEMMRVAKTVYTDGRVPVRVIPEKSGWSYDKDALGNIVNRNQGAYVVYRMPDNTYYMVDLSFKEMYNGGSYGKLQLRGVGMTNQKVVDYK